MKQVNFQTIFQLMHTSRCSIWPLWDHKIWCLSKWCTYETVCSRSKIKKSILKQIRRKTTMAPATWTACRNGSYNPITHILSKIFLWWEECYNTDHFGLYSHSLQIMLYSDAIFFARYTKLSEIYRHFFFKESLVHNYIL